MPQYRDGKVRIANNQTLVRGVWEAFLPLMSFAFDDGIPEIGAPLSFSNGATGEVLAHNLQTRTLTFDLLTGSDPVLGTTVSGATTLQRAAGSVTSGSTVTVLNDSAATWTSGQHNGHWVLLRSGLANAEWRQIGQTLLSPPRLIPATPFNSIATGQAYAIREHETEPIQGFPAGTPQNWL